MSNHQGLKNDYARLMIGEIKKIAKKIEIGIRENGYNMVSPKGARLPFRDMQIDLTENAPKIIPSNARPIGYALLNDADATEKLLDLIKNLPSHPTDPTCEVENHKLCFHLREEKRTFQILSLKLR